MVLPVVSCVVIIFSPFLDHDLFLTALATIVSPCLLSTHESVIFSLLFLFNIKTFLLTYTHTPAGQPPDR